MIITRKHLARRTFLKGVGVAIGLPLLDSMTPAFAAPGSTQAARRLAFVYVPNGAVMANWRPAAAGRDFEFSRILKPLERFRSDISVLTGLAEHTGNALGDGGGDHARAAASYLTGVHPKKTAGADISVGISADQVAANAIGSATRFASLELGCDDTRIVGSCDTGYSCAYTNSIAWRGPASPMPPETNPRVLFERLFGADDLTLSPEVRARRTDYRKSLLDIAGERTRQLIPTLGPSDRRKLDEYLYSVREIEKRIEGAEKDNREVTAGFEKPSGIPVTFSEYVKMMYDIQVLAFRADLTRITTHMIGREGSVRTYSEIGMSDPHHPLSHHRNNPDSLEKLTKINTFHTELFAYFLDKLKSTQDGDGSLLDHSMIVYGSGLSDSNRHLHEDLPTLLAGRAGGTLKPGAHVVFEKETPITNLYLSLLDRMGVRPESIGDSTGKIEHIAGV